MDQAEFLSFTLGDREGVVEVVNNRGEREWIKYPLASPLVKDDLYIALAVSPKPDAPGTYLAIGADTDDLNTASLRLPPSVSIESSKGRFNNIWKLGEEVSETTADELRRRIVPNVVQTRFVRVPGTVSTKYGASFTINVKSASYRSYDLSAITRLPAPNGDVPRSEITVTIPEGTDPLEILALHRRTLPARIYAGYTKKFTDWFRLIEDLLGADLDDEEIVYLAMNAECNPFKKLSYGIQFETIKYIERVRTTKLGSHEAKKIQDIFHLETGVRDKRVEIGNVMIAGMKERGSFIHTVGGMPYFVDHTSGVAIVLERMGSALKQYVNRISGLNPVEPEHRWVVEDVISHASSLPQIGDVMELSYYNSSVNQLMMHFGGRDVFLLNEHGITMTVNGENDIAFCLPHGAEPVISSMLDPSSSASDWWDQFIDPAPLVVGLTQAQASALLHIWTVFILFREGAAARPILSFLGSPGSGKSTMARKIYRLLYGPGVELHTITTLANYDTVTSNFPFVIFDNTDAFRDWLAVALALSISNSESITRTLYTNNDPFVIKRHAMVGVTSANPQFLQDDIIDRMLVFNFRRLEDDERHAEAQLIARVSKNRERYLSGLMADALRVLRTPQIEGTGGVSLRIQDFATLGLWIARGLGIEQDFRDALTGLKRGQLTLALESDQVLIESLESYVTKRPEEAEKWQTSTALWTGVGTYAKDSDAFMRKYKSAPVFGKKLQNALVTLRQVIPLEMQQNEKYGYKEWRICQSPKNDE